MPSSQEIRQQFIDFFKSKGHTAVPSAPVIPQSDPTLLFINAGMNQFKDVFLGTGSRDYTRAVNSQKCIRVSGKHNDLEVVGRDTYHHTFFEMLGNWSFGDYGKREAIKWAWELLTEVWKLPKDRLYATVYTDDDEAESIWYAETDIAKGRVFRFEKDNFWEMGETGPCGPCSEIHIDLRPGPDAAENFRTAADSKQGVNAGNDRFVEIWNLVFIKFERQEDGSLVPLKKSHVDTGMGFERVCSVLQGVGSNFDTDVFTPIIAKIAELSGVDYERGPAGTPHRVIADHIRMLSFSIADGAVPGNEGRGYVVRRILRRAARFGRELGIKEPFLYRLCGTVADVLGETYPELISRGQHVSMVIKAEEESFGATLDRGLELFGQEAAKLSDSCRELGGEVAFRLYDTFGFPFDLTVQMAEERGLTVDEKSFKKCMAERREQSRSDRKFAVKDRGAALAAEVGDNAKSAFAGYDKLEIETSVLGADKTAIVLSETPFYPEGGGQVADRGTISGEDFTFRVDDVQRAGNLILHLGEFTSGNIDSAVGGKEVVAKVDEERRKVTQGNHTATHLLHRALRARLGESAQQAGSLVSPEGLRFDFNHYSKIAPEQLRAIEIEVNVQVRANRELKISQMERERAIESGVTALFGEKYEDVVRVVEIDGYSRELCGGCHVKATGEIGPFVITAESSVASGIRRIEALTGAKAVEYLLDRRDIVSEFESILSVPADSTAKHVIEIISDRKSLAKENEQFKAEQRKSSMDDLLGAAEEIPGGIRVLASLSEEADMDALKGLGDSFREKCPSGTALFAAGNGEKVFLAVAVTDDLVKSGRLKAGDLVKECAAIVGGGGGGKPHLATAGGKDVTKIGEALKSFRAIVEKSLNK